MNAPGGGDGADVHTGEVLRELLELKDALCEEALRTLWKIRTGRHTLRRLTRAAARSEEQVHSNMQLLPIIVDALLEKQREEGEGPDGGDGGGDSDDGDDSDSDSDGDDSDDGDGPGGDPIAGAADDHCDVGNKQ